MKPQSTFNLSLKINGNPWSGEVPVEETLLEFLRVRLRLTGTKRSCESEVCGACTVLVDGRPVSSCNYLAFEAHGRSVLSIEGVARGDELDPLQEAFIRNIGAQCGYCTPGQIMAAKSLLMENPQPTREQIADWLAGQHLSLRCLRRDCPIDSRSGGGVSQTKRWLKTSVESNSANWEKDHSRERETRREIGSGEVSYLLSLDGRGLR